MMQFVVYFHVTGNFAKGVRLDALFFCVRFPHHLPHYLCVVLIHNAMTNDFIKHRQAAIDWLNGKRDFDAGINVLEKSKFKPGVVARLKRDGVNGREAKARLVHIMRSLVQAWAMPDDQLNDNTDPATGVDADEQPTIVTDSSDAYINMAVEKLMVDPEAYPKRIAAVIREYADAYKKRDILHKQLADLPEDNDEATVAKRKELSDEIKAKTELMERMYPLYEKFQSLNEDISEEDIQSLENPTDDTQSIDEKDSSVIEPGVGNLDGRTKDELQKIRKSVATKIGRAKNMLEYQQETKAETPNPMPESPKKVKYETKIANLTKELEQIDYAIAKLG